MDCNLKHFGTYLRWPQNDILYSLLSTKFSDVDFKKNEWSIDYCFRNKVIGYIQFYQTGMSYKILRERTI
jgi:hypothetical protein